MRHVLRAAAETEQSIGAQAPTAHALSLKYGNRNVRECIAGSV